MNDKQFDELLQTTIPIACCEDCCEIEKQMILEGEHVFSKKYEKNIKTLIKGHKKCIREENTIKYKTHAKFRYVLLAILLAILSSITVLAHEPIKEALKELFFSIHSEHIRFHSMDHQEISDLDLTESVLLKPTYIPDGYELIDESINESLKDVSMTWLDEAGKVLSYQQWTPKGGEMVLSSDGKVPKDIKIGEITGKLISEEDGMNTILYEEDTVVFVISGFLEKEELISILLSIK